MKDESSIFDAEPENLDRLVFEILGDSGSEEDSNSAATLNGVLEQPGSQIGRYKLLSVLGEGGMGIVYLAEQQEPIRRKVALKVIKPGMDSKAVIARFEAERQALALLEHPNIAHVHDAGTTETGRPYFVMEYVKGVPITEHCDRQKLTIKERLQLFLKVCEAVQHAHLNGIIHRDLKPSNVQVTIQGQQSIPKVIDFGVAKAINRVLTERTLVTEQGQFVGTPEYMSPEQAEMTGQDVDTRSDIYLLGVLLYELLTGVLPFDPKTLREKGFDHIRRIIREEEPKTPSTRLSTFSGEDSTKLAQLRRTDVRTLSRQLHGDLDWITLKAMEKDRTRRYQTAHAFAEDIQRHLNNEPVLAGPPSNIYRLKKFFLKHQTQAIGTAVAGIFIAVIAVISVMYIQAANRSKEAESLKDKSILSKVQEYRSEGQYKDALTQVEAIVDSKYVGPQARLLRAQIVLNLHGPDEAISILEKLTSERDEIASQAHFLLARIYLETDPDNPEDAPEYQRKGKYHQQKGEKLFSESPEAYYNRSMMAGSVNSILEWLDKALELDPGHYDSLEARSLAYYALKKYDEMEHDAYGMIVKESKNPRGYALRAIARREKAIQQDKKELLSKAIIDHDTAISLSENDAKLYGQRRQTHLQMGNYLQVLSDAKKCVSLQPDKGIYHFHEFCALVALGRYGEAKIKYETIIGSGLMEKTGLEGIDDMAEAYVFDILDAGLSWHPSESEPNRAFLLPMVEGEEYYHQLAEKGQRVVPDGFAPDWSPNGTELVYSRGMFGHSGIEILNLKTRKIRLLTPSGMDPSWSPDGEYIVFVRGRRTATIADLTTEQKHEQPRAENREIWLIKADGSKEPRFLTKGMWPHWHQNSKEIFYGLPGYPNTTCTISIEPGSEPKPIGWCGASNPTVSPDGEYIAWARYFDPHLYVTDRFGSLIVNWAGPRGMLLPSWSPDGRELIIGSGWRARPGLWIYDMDKKEASKVISGRGIMKGLLSPPDGKQMVFALEPPFLDIWVADTASLGSGRALEDHYQEEVDRITRRIEYNPQVAGYYSRRSLSNIFLGNKKEVLDDLIKYEVLVNNPDDPNNQLNVAEAYSNTAWGFVRTHREIGDPEIAVELFQKAHKMQPNNWNYLCGLGAAYYRTGQWEKAIENLMESTKLVGGKNACSLLFLAMAYWQLGNKTKAKNFYNMAIEWIDANKDYWLSNYDHMIFEIYVEASELMSIEINELFTKGILHIWS
jgi:serine/threonine protein kinase/Tol biopolymer transport system component